jgi:hypothetical protein
LSTIAASKLNISGHGSPRGDCTARPAFCARGIFFCIKNLYRKPKFWIFGRFGAGFASETFAQPGATGVSCTLFVH